MPLPIPRPGLVIGYSYLWRREHLHGKSEGAKDRPCVIVLMAQNTPDKSIVTIAPITHSPPDTKTAAIEIPLATKQRLGLDSERSWVVISEVNRFIWPGPDLRPISREQPDRFDYGMLPPSLFGQITKRLVEFAREGRAALLNRGQ